MISINGRRKFRAGLLLACACVPQASLAQEATYEFGGHIKARLLGDWYPGDSAFNAEAGASAFGVESDLRLNIAMDKGPWDVDAAWQLVANHGELVELSRALSGGLPLAGSHLQNDERRLMNLTDTIRDKGKFAALHRLDRLSVAYTSDRLVLRLGRQAISWGNGLVFSPLDIVNPFDPTAVDTEYKSGDDMLYGQLLLANGDDLQFAHVFRSNPLSGSTDPSAATSAIKYHGVLESAEYDLFVASNHDDLTLAIGGTKDVGGAVLRGDVVWADTTSGGTFQVVTSLSYSWVLGGKNMSGVLEYYYSALGQREGRYGLAALAQNDALLSRLVRGESFTLGRNYLAGGVTIEMSPLWTVTPNLFANLDDGSALLQAVSRLSLGDNAEFLAALNVPIGPNGSEFGGIESAATGVYFSSTASLFMQFAFYF